LDDEAMLPVWLQYAQAGALILIPLVGAFIAWQQARIAWSKLQFDLYEKRFAIFAAARKLIGEAISQGNVSDASWQAYMLGTADVFLLNDELSKYLNALGKRAAMLQPLNYELESLPVGSARRIELSKKRGEELVWWNDRPDELVAHFRPFLRLPSFGVFHINYFDRK
jgi:hypothetical protein